MVTSRNVNRAFIFLKKSDVRKASVPQLHYTKQILTHFSWSFGVVLWEVVTLGGSPYYELSDKEVMNKVPMGLRLMKPVNASDKLYDVMITCWRNEAESRPNFNEILRLLQEFNLNPEVIFQCCVTS